MCGALRSNERKAHRFYKNNPSLPFITDSKENKDSEGYWDKNYQCEYYSFLELSSRIQSVLP